MTNTKILIAVSNTLGRDSIAQHGFEWIILPTNKNCFNQLVEKLFAIEDEWSIRITKWTAEGIIETRKDSQKGIMFWVLDLLHPKLNFLKLGELEISTLYEAAMQISSSPQHVMYLANSVGLNQTDLVVYLNNIKGLDISVNPDLISTQAKQEVLVHI